MKRFFFLLSFFTVLSAYFPSSVVDAATYTVCASGCDYTTITDAKNAASTPGDIISVQATYSAAGETFPISINTASTTISCSAGATIGQTTPTGNNTLQLTTSSTVSGCAFSNIQLYTGADAYYSGLIIADNTFAAGASSTIWFSGSMGHTSILRNTNLDGISFVATSTNISIQDNTFYGDRGVAASGLLLNVSATSSNLVIQNNMIESRITSASAENLKLISLLSDGLTFTTNTIRYREMPPAQIVGTAFFGLAEGTHAISGNKIESQPKTVGDTNSCAAMSIFPASDMVQTIRMTVRNNTFRNRCDAGNLLAISDSGSLAAVVMYVSSTRNLFYAERGSSKGAMEFSRGVGTTLVGTLDENWVYGTFAGNRTNAESADVEAGTNYLTLNPHLQLNDASAENDLDVAPFSLALNIDGSGTKIGASTTTRRTTIYVDDDGTLDYSTIDATSTTAVTATLRSGDTLSLAAGTYGGFSVDSSYVTTSLTITGAGATTIIDAATNANALALANVTSTSVSGLMVRNASSTQTLYASTRMNFEYGGNAYADALGDIGITINSTAYINDQDLGSVTVVDTDGDDVSTVTGMGSQAYHLALVDVGGTRATFIIPNGVFSSSADASAYWAGAGIVIDRFVTNTFTVADGAYTYDAAAIAAAGVTLSGGLTAPALTSSVARFAGIKLTNSDNVTITNVTSTLNAYGIWFASGGGNRLYDSVLSSSSLYDIRQDASATNTVDNVTFTRVSSTVDVLAAPVLVKVRARAQVYRLGFADTMVSSTTITATDGLSAATSFGQTDATGYTSYARVPAYTITNASAATSNGGYNDYTFAASSVSGYSSTSTTATLSSRDQTVTLVAYATTPTAPSSPAAASIAATTTQFSWTDNASNETSFTINYVTSSLGQVLGTDIGTTSTTSAGVTSTTFAGLLANTQYRFRVAAVNEGGTSAYATSSAFYTLAVAPGAPTVTAAGRTTATVVLDGGVNATSTEFLLYNSTLGSYVTSTGATASTPYWATTSTWATITIADLTCNTSYSFVSVARNGDGTETSTSTAGTVTTSACATVSVGGGGGGGVGASGSVSIPLPIASTAPVSTTPSAPLPPIIVADTPPLLPTTVPSLAPTTPLPSAAPTTVRLLQNDARAFGVTVTAADQERLASFVDNGTTPETRALGSGERRALVRDALQTMGRSNLPLADLERMARGEIPTTRNLVREREQLPRVRSTFRSIYNRDPNFKNADENLVWNTLMYRIRFPRDLAAEREGIQDFRRAFNRAPSDPFQWAVVRALGYVL